MASPPSQVWDELLGSPQLEGRQTYLIMNAGLVHARSESLPCILNYQFPLLRDYLSYGLPSLLHNATSTGGAATRLRRVPPSMPSIPSIPSVVRVVYLASPPTQQEAPAAWMGAQDGMLQARPVSTPSRPCSHPSAAPARSRTRGRGRAQLNLYGQVRSA